MASWPKRGGRSNMGLVAKMMLVVLAALGVTTPKARQLRERSSQFRPARVSSGPMSGSGLAEDVDASLEAQRSAREPVMTVGDMATWRSVAEIICQLSLCSSRTALRVSATVQQRCESSHRRIDPQAPPSGRNQSHAERLRFRVAIFPKSRGSPGISDIRLQTGRTEGAAD